MSQHVSGPFKLDKRKKGGIGFSTYNELASHEDDDATIGSGLSIGLAVLMLDLLEGEALQMG